MPKLDIIHNVVKNALIIDGWIITDDPYLIQYRRTTLCAERPIAIEKSGQKLVVEDMMTTRNSFQTPSIAFNNLTQIFTRNGFHKDSSINCFCGSTSSC